MKNLLYILSFSLSLLTFGLSAQTGSVPLRLEQMPEYAAIISADRVLVSYRPQTTDATISDILKNCPALYMYQPAKPMVPGRFLAKLKPGHTWKDAAQALAQVPEVVSVTPWLRDANGSERGILPQLYVKLRSDGDVPFLRETAQKYMGTWMGERPDMPGIWRMDFDKTAPFNAWEMALFLNARPQVEFACPNTAFFPRVNSVDDSLFFRQWSLQNTGGLSQWSGTPGADMEVVPAWAVTTGSPSIKIAIMDSGVDTLHPDLRPNLLPGFDATGNGSHGYPNTNFASDGHGTACAGIAAAKGNNHIGVAGVAYDCKIVPVKMFVYIDTNLVIPGFIDTALYEIPYSETDYMVSGTNWAWQTAGADVMSNSWGVPMEMLLIAPIDQALVNAAINTASQQGRGGKGAVQLFSTGNDNTASLIWPSNLPSNIAVGATTNKDKRAGFSNYGSGLDVCAPGVQVTTTDMLGANGFAATDYMLDFGGTSAACPNAAGVAALVLSVVPDLTYAEVRTVLRITAEKVGGYAYGGTQPDGTWSSQLGYGRINALNAVTAAPVLSIHETPDSKVSVALYPNPAVNTVNLFGEGLPQGQLSYRIIDVQGKAVQAGTLLGNGNGEQVLSIPVDGLSAGFYCLYLQCGDALLPLKFVKN